MAATGHRIGEELLNRSAGIDSASAAHVFHVPPFAHCALAAAFASE